MGEEAWGAGREEQRVTVVQLAAVREHRSPDDCHLGPPRLPSINLNNAHPDKANVDKANSNKAERTKSKLAEANSAKVNSAKAISTKTKSGKAKPT